MKVLLRGSPIQLAASDVLGQGGEAVVYRVGAEAVKIWSDTDPGHLADRARKLAAFPVPTPARVLGPTDPVLDAKKRTVGYAMPLLEGGAEVRSLGQRRLREGKRSAEDVLAVFRSLSELLGALHPGGLVVGDLNDANVLFRGTEAFLIDTDSMQYGAFPCPVAHAHFLDPRLHGVDLASGRHFTPDTDWYAFAVMLFQSLLYLHPFGGVHPRLGTLERRAEARHSVLKGDVALPKAALPPDSLPDDLLDHFARTFDRDARGRFPSALLAARFTRCACGLEHARRVCPDCARRGTIVVGPPERHAGRVKAVTIHRTPGRILAARTDGALRFASFDGQRVLREDGGLVFAHPPPERLTVSFAGRETWLCLDGEAVLVRDGAPIRRVTTGRYGPWSTFAATAGGAVRLEDGWLVEVERGLRIGAVVEGQTFIAAGESLGYGFSRASRLTMHFLFRLGEAGLVPVDLPPIDGRLVDLDVVFDARHALVSLFTEARGEPRVTTHLVGADGRRLASADGPVGSGPLFRSVRGRAIASGRIVVATDQGLLAVAVERGHLVPGRLFTDTEAFVSDGVELLPGRGGSIYVVGAQEITELTLT